MKKFLLFALLAFILFAVVSPITAQDATAEPTAVPTVEVTPIVTPAPEQPPVIVVPGTDYSILQIVVVVLALLLVGVLAIFGATIVPLVRNALNSLPPWAVDIIRADAPKLLDQVDKVFDIPGTDLDDIARARLRQAINEILTEQAERVQGLPPGRG